MSNQLDGKCGTYWQENNFESFWRHYNLAQDWIRIHSDEREETFKFYQAEANKGQQKVSKSFSTEAMNLIEPPNVVVPSNIKDFFLQNEDNAEMKPQRQKQAANKPYNNNTSRKDHKKSEPETTNKEYEEFRRQTNEHRRQLKEKRREEQQREKEMKAKGVVLAQSDGEEYYDAAGDINELLSGSAKDACDVAIERHGREWKRRQLYGTEGVEKLHKNEEAFQAKFVAEVEKHRPNLWPNIPLRL